MPTDNNSILQAIQVDTADRLLADPYFSNVPVLTENLLDIEYQIDVAIQQLGIVCIIVTPTTDVGHMQDAPGPYFEHINLVVRVMENVTLNRGVTGTQKTAQGTAERVLALLHNYTPTSVTEALFAASPTLTLVADPNGLLSYDCMLKTHGGIKYDVPIIEDPVITSDGTFVYITTDTPNAQIFTSDDGRYPNPRTGDLYTEPLVVPEGTTVKARAWLAGWQTSKIISFKFTGVSTGQFVRSVNGTLQLLGDQWYSLNIKTIDGEPDLALTANSPDAPATSRVKDGQLQLLSLDDGLWYSVTIAFLSSTWDFVITPDDILATNPFLTLDNEVQIGQYLRIYGEDNAWHDVAIVMGGGEPELAID